ncbi:MAG: hypothetical protein GX258_02560 [Clostridiales bacterium]|nr:hypothetical protein [Clostridiales bacterium]
MEYFYEQFQTKDYSKFEKVLSIISKALIILAILSLIIRNIFLLVLFLILYLINFIVSRKIIIEYEYELTGDEISIYKIKNKSVRKELGSFNINNIISIKEYQDINNKNTKIIKACLDETGFKNKIIMIKKSDELVGFQLAMDEKLTDLIKKINPLLFYK